MDSTDLKQFPDEWQRTPCGKYHAFWPCVAACWFADWAGQVIEAMRAVSQVGLGSRKDFYWSLFSVFVNRRDQREVFDQAFHIFWRNPEILERMMQLVLPDIGSSQTMAEAEEISRRVAEAVSNNKKTNEQEIEQEEIEFDAALTWSAGETLAGKDFEKMSGDEIKMATNAVKKNALTDITGADAPLPPDSSGSRVDMRRTLRARFARGRGIFL